MEGVRGVTPARRAGAATARPATSLDGSRDDRRAGGRRRVRARRRDRRCASLPLVVDGPGHQRATRAAAPTADAIAPGATAHDHDRRRRRSQRGATLAVRVSDRARRRRRVVRRRPGRARVGGTTTQNLASSDPPWHTWVAPAQLDGRRHLRLRSAAPECGARYADRRRRRRACCSWRVDRASSAVVRRDGAARAGPLRALGSQDDRRRRRRRGVDRADGAMSERRPPPQSARADAARHVRARLPRVLRAAGADHDARRADQRRLRLHDDAHQDHRRREADARDRRVRQGLAGGARRDVSASTKRSATRCPTTCAPVRARAADPRALRHPDRRDRRRRGRRRDRDARAHRRAKTVSTRSSSPAISTCCRSSTTRRPCSRRAAASPTSAATMRPRCASASTSSRVSCPITAGSKAIRPTTCPASRASARRPRSSSIKAAGSLDALLADPEARRHAEARSAGARTRREGAHLPRRLDHQARSRRSTLDWERGALHAAGERRALRALPRARVQVAARANSTPPDERRSPVSTDEPLQRHVRLVRRGDRSAGLRAARRTRCAKRRDAPRVALALRGDAIGVSAADESGRSRSTAARSANPAIGAAFAALWERVPQLVAYDAKAVIGDARSCRRATIADDPMIARAPARSGAHLRRRRAGGVGGAAPRAARRCRRGRRRGLRASRASRAPNSKRASSSRSTPTSRCRWPWCWRRSNAPASRSIRRRWSICARASTPTSSGCRARSTQRPARRSTSARRSSSAASSSTTSSLPHGGKNKTG